MNRSQKIAWFSLITLAVALCVTAGAFVTLLMVGGIEKASVSVAFMSIFGIAGLSPLIFREDKGKVKSDERDTLIGRTSALAGFAASYLFFVAVCMVSWHFYKDQGSIPAKLVVTFPFGGLAVSEAVRATVLLVLYRKGEADGQ